MKGTPNRNTVILRDVLAEAEANPAEALVDIARRAEAEGNLALAADCWGKLAAFAYPKPRPTVLDPEQVIAFEAALASAVARAKLQAEAEVVEANPGLLGLAERLERAHHRLCLVEVGALRVSDAPNEDVASASPPPAPARLPAATELAVGSRRPAAPPLPAKPKPMEVDYDPFGDL